MITYMIMKNNDTNFITEYKPNLVYFTQEIREEKTKQLNAEATTNRYWVEKVKNTWKNEEK